jgi:hypothetical protein
MHNQIDNFREAIENCKARIATIELQIGQVPASGHVIQTAVMRLIKEKQHLQFRASELENQILLLQYQKTADTAPPTTKGQPLISANAREAFVLPILKQKGWSTNDWAQESKVDFHTADDYLKGETHPYRSTRKKLAVALGLAEDKLPA